MKLSVDGRNGLGAIPLLVFMAFALMEMQALGAGSFDPFLSTADIARLLPAAGMVVSKY